MDGNCLNLEGKMCNLLPMSMLVLLFMTNTTIEQHVCTSTIFWIKPKEAYYELEIFASA